MKTKKLSMINVPFMLTIIDLIKRDAGNPILNTWRKQASADFSASNRPPRFTLLC